MANRRPHCFVLIGLFFAFGAAAAAYAAITLLFPGTRLDVLWTLNERGHAGLLGLGKVAGSLFILLSAALLATAVGWFRRRRWAWMLGVTIVALNAAGDAVNVASGGDRRSGIGVVVAGLLLFYLTRRGVREYFRRQQPESAC